MINIQKPTYLIAGGRGRNILSTFHIIEVIVRYIGKAKPTIAYVGVASLGDNWFIYLIISDLLRVMCHCQVQRILIAPKNADPDKAQEALESADMVFLSGGDMEAGMKILEEKNMVGFFRNSPEKENCSLGLLPEVLCWLMNGSNGEIHMTNPQPCFSPVLVLPRLSVIRMPKKMTGTN
jgi:hypothetical protein